MKQAATRKQIASAATKRARVSPAAESKTATAYRNVTLSLPESLLRRFRIYAAEQDQSMTQIAALAISHWMQQSDERQRVQDRMIERMRNAPDRGLGGRITWTRDEIHDRLMRER